LKTLGLIGLAVAAVATAALLVSRPGGPAFAQTPPDPDAGGRHDRYEQLLAEQLGITVEQLQAAQRAARDRLIDEAVASGKLRPELAEKLKNAEPGAIRPAIGRAVKKVAVNVIEEAANILGLSVQQVRDAFREGKSLNDLAQEQGVDDFQAKLEAALTEKIRQAVAEGSLNQEAADRLQEALSARIDDLVNATPGHGDGRPLLPFFKDRAPRPSGSR